MKTIISKKVPSLNRTTETVGGLEKLKQLKDRELREVAGGGGRVHVLSKNIKKCIR